MLSIIIFIVVFPLFLWSYLKHEKATIYVLGILVLISFVIQSGIDNGFWECVTSVCFCYILFRCGQFSKIKKKG